MTRRRFFAPPAAIHPEKHTIALDQSETRHLRDVLRLRAGDEVFVFDGQGREYRCQVTDATAKLGELRVVEPAEPARPESPLQFTLAVALLKGEKFDLVVQKATELGVTRIIPVLTERSEVRIAKADAAAKRVERWQRLALEAAKQSGRAVMPDCEEPVPWADLLRRVTATDGAIRCVFTEREGDSFDAVCASITTKIVAVVGPEGGWADNELDQARDQGWRLITLGGRILRAETAAITVAALLQHRFGDLS